MSSYPLLHTCPTLDYQQSVISARDERVHARIGGNATRWGAPNIRRRSPRGVACSKFSHVLVILLARQSQAEIREYSKSRPIQLNNEIQAYLHRRYKVWCSVRFSLRN